MNPIAWALAWGLSSAGPLEEKTPQEVLSQLERDLREAIKTGLKNKDIRSKLSKAAQERFARELASSAAPKSPKSVWEYAADHLDNLATAETFFKEADDKAERTLWFGACRSTFERLKSASKETSLPAKDLPTTEKAYDDLVDAVGKVERRFTKQATDLRKEALGVSRQAFNLAIASARAPSGSSEAWYTKQLIEIDRVYPIGTDEQKAANQERNQLLKAAAKNAYDRARTAPK